MTQSSGENSSTNAKLKEEEEENLLVLPGERTGGCFPSLSLSLSFQTFFFRLSFFSVFWAPRAENEVQPAFFLNHNSPHIFIERKNKEKQIFKMSIQSTTQKTPIVDKRLDAATIKKL